MAHRTTALTPADSKAVFCSPSYLGIPQPDAGRVQESRRRSGHRGRHSRRRVARAPIAVTERGICWLGFVVNRDGAHVIRELHASWPGAPSRTRRISSGACCRTAEESLRTLSELPRRRRCDRRAVRGAGGWRRGWRESDLARDPRPSRHREMRLIHYCRWGTDRKRTFSPWNRRITRAERQSDCSGGGWWTLREAGGGF